MWRALSGLCVALGGVMASGAAWAQATVVSPAAGVVPFQVIGDAIPQPLGGLRGDATRGRAIVASRRAGLCLLCHQAPIAEERFQGNLAPDLAGSGARWSPGQLRLRVVDSRRINPHSLMPAYHRIDGLVRVGAAWQGRPVLDAQQIEDVVAWLSTLRN
jgi:sulfur-oxidizing protein SoxX